MCVSTTRAHRWMWTSGADLRRQDSTLHARRVERNCRCVRFNYTHRRMWVSGADLRRHDSTLHARRVEHNCNVTRFTKAWCGTAVHKYVNAFTYTAGDGTRWDRTGTRHINAGVCAATSLLGSPSCNCACATEMWLAEASRLSCRSA